MQTLVMDKLACCAAGLCARSAESHHGKHQQAVAHAGRHAMPYLAAASIETDNVVVVTHQPASSHGTVTLLQQSTMAMDPVKTKEAVNPEEAWLQTLNGTDAEGVIDLFKNVPDYVKESKACVLATVRKKGLALEFAATPLRQDKVVVMTAAQQDASSLAYAGGVPNQDSVCLKCAGLFDMDEHRPYPRMEEAFLSVQYTRCAINFHCAIKRDPFLDQFKVYNPTLWRDPDSFAELKACIDTNGFMIQLQETGLEQILRN